MDEINAPLKELEKINIEDVDSDDVIKTAKTTKQEKKSQKSLGANQDEKIEKKKNYRTKNKSPEKKKANQGKGCFEFPDGGWECSKCQNYNFKGRKECNRCKKARTTKDLSGKPAHLIKAEKE